jgi:putative effector of murein hydrolase LrgA (UPF0299 family)
VGPVTAASAAGTASAVVIVYVASLFGLQVPDPVAGALALLLTVAGGLLAKPAGTGDHADTD